MRLIGTIAILSLCVVVVVDLFYVLRRLRSYLARQRRQHVDAKGYLRAVPPRRARRDKSAS